VAIVDPPIRSPHDDAEVDALLARAAAGDRDAFVAFYDATAPHVYAVLLALTDPASAERTLHAAHVEAWQRTRERGAPPCPGREWMSVIARRHAPAAH